MIKAAIYGRGRHGGTLGALIEKSGGTIDYMRAIPRTSRRYARAA